MAESTFTIYNASAGSGKTYTLAKSYLQLLLGSEQTNAFKNILAITFTNKAVNEMKNRIIEMLKQFSSEETLKQPNTMFVALCEDLKLSPTQLHLRSKAVLNQLIHNYAAFDISTIDGFTHRIIRTFAFDLKLPVNFEVVLDAEDLLNKAVDSLIAKAGTDPQLTKTLVTFAIEKADDDRSWDIAYDFREISKLLVQENDLSHIKKLKDKTLNDFENLKTKVVNDITRTTKIIRDKSESTLQLISEAGLEHSDFKGGYLPKHFLRLNSPNKLNFSSAWQIDLVEGNTLYPQRVSETVAQIIEAIQPQIAEIFLETKALLYHQKFLKAVLKNITPLSVLNAIRQELETIKEEENKLLISEFDALISEEVSNQPTPFIYERLGEKFRHYFIDEFQDTSNMQWQNLKPLISNKLESTEGSLMLLGDAKQSIYRWRGGEAEQFINLYQKTGNPFQVDADVKPLDTNYRSSKTIVDFNNSFFEFISDTFFAPQDYKTLYKSATQKNYLNDTGFVRFDFLNLENEAGRDAHYCEKTLSIINQCLEDGFGFGHISILVRKRKEGVALAEYLSENDVPIVSSETVLLNNSPKVQFLISMFNILNNPSDHMLRIECLHFMAERLQIVKKHAFYVAHIRLPITAFFKALEQFEISLSYTELVQMPLYELTETIVREFNLSDNNDAYIQFFLDLIFDFTNKQGSDLQEFLSHYESKKEKLSISIPLETNAVQIMTIHKAKGLEFPVVIFPFADQDFYREPKPKEWFPLNPKEFNGFDIALLDFNKDFENFGVIGEEIHSRHQAQLELDAVNLLYVTFTRAVSRLYIVSKLDLNKKGQVNDRTYSGLFIKYLQHKKLWNSEEMAFIFGKRKQASHLNNNLSPDESETIDFISTSRESRNLKILAQAGYLWDTELGAAREKGNLTHLILSKIKTKDDIEAVFDDMNKGGTLDNAVSVLLKEHVKSILENPSLEKYFSDHYIILNEKDIITKNGLIYRPDRVAIKDNLATVIDYKTGAQDISHKSQIEEYGQLLEDMGYTVSEKILVYIDESLKILKV